MFFYGIGGDSLLFGPDTAESKMMASSPGVTNAVNSYLQTGQTSGLYTFGLNGLVHAGLNPTQQFVGSYRWSVTPARGVNHDDCYTNALLTGDNIHRAESELAYTLRILRSRTDSLRPLISKPSSALVLRFLSETSQPVKTLLLQWNVALI